MYLPDTRVQLKPQTVDYLQKTFRSSLLPALGSTRLNEVNPKAIAALARALYGRELSAKTINNTLSALRATLAHAVDHEVLAAVPCVHWQRVPPTRFDFFTFDEVDRLIPHAPPMVVVALRTGMRIGELLALKWSDISFDREQLQVSRSIWWERGGTRHEGSPQEQPSTDDPPHHRDSRRARGPEGPSARSDGRSVFVDEAGLGLRRRRASGRCGGPRTRPDSAVLATTCCGTRSPATSSCAAWRSPPSRR